MDPTRIGISQPERVVPIPDKLPKVKKKGDEIATTVDTDAVAEAAAEAGIAALQGEPGPAYDSLVYGAAICLLHLKRYGSLQAGADAVREVIDAGEAPSRFRAQQNRTR